MLKRAIKVMILTFTAFVASSFLAVAAENRYSESDKQNARHLWAAAVKKGDYVRVMLREVHLPSKTAGKVKEFLLDSIEFELVKDDLPTEGYGDYWTRGYSILKEVVRSSKKELSSEEVHGIFSRYYLLAKNVAQAYSQYKASFNASKGRRQILRDKLVQLAGERSVRRLDAALGQ
ncbi:MAG: hypothetical protein IPM23_13290 [Candidatus Melainabacteria bacterium]|nr:hypothetical protein [Candidatus Melainabacteria bacterium]